MSAHRAGNCADLGVTPPGGRPGPRQARKNTPKRAKNSLFPRKSSGKTCFWHVFGFTALAPR
jgi:hypothetical protein